MNEQEQRELANLARLMALTCFHNGNLEDIHAGKVPVSRTGDFSDVTVVDAEGRRIPWPEVSHFDGGAMREPMRQVVDRLYRFYAMGGDPDFQDSIECWIPVALRVGCPQAG